MMLRLGRVVLKCWKFLSRGVYDSFEITVPEARKAEYKAKYESMGYAVKEVG
jgi:hypothetical protein